MKNLIIPLTDFEVPGAESGIKVLVLNDPGSGGACHDYFILTPVTEDDGDLTEVNVIEGKGYRLHIAHAVKHGFDDHGMAIAVEDLDGDDDPPVLYGGPGSCHIHFQQGPVKEAGVNGLTHEILLGIVKHRLQSFQAGPFPHECNALALNACQEATAVLHRRTQERLSRGVEGQTKA